MTLRNSTRIARVEMKKQFNKRGEIMNLDTT